MVRRGGFSAERGNSPQREKRKFLSFYPFSTIPAFYSFVPYDCLLDLLLLDAALVDLLKCDGFFEKTLIYIPLATICRQGKESSA